MRLGDSGPSISMDTFNDPHLQLPGIGETVSASFPSTAMLVLEQPTAPIADEVAAAEA
jgi:hypothetical protein